MWNQEVEVLTITQATAILSGELVYQVSFGLIGAPVSGIAPPQIKKVSSNVLVIFLSRDQECPYTVGSKWMLKVGDDGTVTLNKKEI